MPDSCTDDVFLTWIHGWAAARSLAPPVPHGDGFHITVGAPRQASRYVFPRPSPTLRDCGAAIAHPERTTVAAICAQTASVTCFVVAVPPRSRV